MINELQNRNQNNRLNQGQNRPLNQGKNNGQNKGPNHPGNLPLNQDQKQRWEIAFKAEEAQLAAQRKFHTSEFTRYENRDRQYVAENNAWNQNSDIRTRFRAVMESHRIHSQIQNGLNETIDIFQKARGPFIEIATEARKNAIHWKEPRANLDTSKCNVIPANFSVIQNHQVAQNLKGGEANNLTVNQNNIQVDKQVENRLNKMWKTYIEAAKIANDSQKVFHIVEFKEFDGRQQCVNDARRAIAQGNATPRLIKEMYRGGLQQVQQEVRKAEIEIADQTRKANQGEVNGLFQAWREASQEAIKCLKNNK